MGKRNSDRRRDPQGVHKEKNGDANNPYKHFPRRTVDHELRTVCGKLGLEGVSTHSFRRSALTAASSKGVPLRGIQSISGHSSLDILQRYLSVTDNQKKEAALAFD